eukprot:gene13008-26182_t
MPSPASVQRLLKGGADRNARDSDGSGRCGAVGRRRAHTARCSVCRLPSCLRAPRPRACAGGSGARSQRALRRRGKLPVDLARDREHDDTPYGHDEVVEVLLGTDGGPVGVPVPPTFVDPTAPQDGSHPRAPIRKHRATPGTMSVP